MLLYVSVPVGIQVKQSQMGSGTLRPFVVQYSAILRRTKPLESWEEWASVSRGTSQQGSLERILRGKVSKQ